MELPWISTSVGSKITGMKISSRRITMIFPNTPSSWMIKAVVHCFVLAPPSSGLTARIGGAMMYRNRMLNILATRFSRITKVLYRIAIPRT